MEKSMFGNLTTTGGISFMLVFLEGILSFFSPCVIPLIPVYVSYLAGNTNKDGEEVIIYEKRKVLFHTLFFILGISFAFFILGMSFNVIGKFFHGNKILFTRIGGILIIILGLFQLGVFDFPFLQKERKIHLNLSKNNVNFLVAFIMGFTFSFAWTPCVGPALSSVLIMASSAKTGLLGNILILVYALGFVLPFLLLGLFTTQALNFLKEKKILLKYTIKAGGIILIVMGIITFTGWMNGISGYLNSFSTDNQNETGYNEGVEDNKEDAALNNDTNQNQDNSLKAYPPAYDFILTDQYGNKHTLSDYKGKVVFLNFWASWCGPCQREMPDIEELYQKYNLNQDEVVFLGVANPRSEAYPQNSDEEKGEIMKFLEKNGYTYPTVFDETGEIFMNYYITAFPTTFLINKEGNVLGYIPGMITKDIMENVIEQTLESTIDIK